jgi:hypothetical protein
MAEIITTFAELISGSGVMYLVSFFILFIGFKTVLGGRYLRFDGGTIGAFVAAAVGATLMVGFFPSLNEGVSNSILSSQQRGSAIAITEQQYQQITESHPMYSTERNSSKINVSYNLKIDDNLDILKT